MQSVSLNEPSGRCPSLRPIWKAWTLTENRTPHRLQGPRVLEWLRGTIELSYLVCEGQYRVEFLTYTFPTGLLIVMLPLPPKQCSAPCLSLLFYRGEKSALHCCPAGAGGVAVQDQPNGFEHSALPHWHFRDLSLNRRHVRRKQQLRNPKAPNPKGSPEYPCILPREPLSHMSHFRAGTNCFDDPGPFDRRPFAGESDFQLVKNGNNDFKTAALRILIPQLRIQT